MSNVLDDIIEDLVKGASRNTRENGGPGVNIVVARENRGREEKRANHDHILGPALGAALGSGFNAVGGMGPPALGPAMAALSATGHGGSPIGAGAGSYVGGGLGSLGGGALAELLHLNPATGATIGHMLGSAGGAAAGSAMRDERDKVSMFGGPGGPMDPQVAAARMVHGMESPIRKETPMVRGGGGAKPPPIPAAAFGKAGPSPFAAPPKLGGYYDNGVNAALETFGVKEAFVPALAAGAARLAPLAGRAMSAVKGLFGGGGGGALKSVGNFAMNHPVGQQIAGTAASNVVNRMMQPSQPS